MNQKKEEEKTEKQRRNVLLYLDAGKKMTNVEAKVIIVETMKNKILKNSPFFRKENVTFNISICFVDQ